MPRPIRDQVVVITGASSGIGRVTARMFAERGARVVVGARNIDALRGLEEEIRSSGGEAAAVQTDVTSREQVERLAQAAVDRYGRIDTWINNAGVSIYSKFEKVTEEEARRIVEVNFMGVFHGMQAALPILRAGGGGTIINVASVAGKRAIPLQNVYSATKYAVIGLGEAVRTELVNESPEINICAICPPSINTPFFTHARTKEGYAPRPLPPVYEPEAVAEAILSCAERPEREVLIGTAGKAFALLNTIAPGLTDWFLAKTGINGQLTNEPKSSTAPDNLFGVPQEARERGEWTAAGTRARPGSPAESLMTKYPLALPAVGLVALAVAARLWLR